ncbi:MAG TPA: prepilin peptidase, partial [Solirubrobacter sp.]
MSVGVGAVLAAIFGAIVGSFLNVVAYRLPRHESLLHPPSACPSCGTPIKPYDNVPVLGWLWLRGKCRACKAPISPKYPIVEAVTGLLCAACVLHFGADSDVWLPIVFVLLLVPITLIDLEFHIIPNVLSAIGAVAAIVLVLAFQSDELVEHLIAALGAGGFFLIAAITLGTTIVADNFRERALASAESQLQNNVLLMARHFDQQFEDFMGIQRDVVSQIERSGVASPGAFRTMMSAAEWHDLLRLRL